MARLRKLTWREIDKPSVAELFEIWMEGAELAWLKRAWRKLGAAGPLNYRAKEECYRVGASVFVLARLYQGFCARAFDLSHETSFTEAAEDLGITPAALASFAEIADDHRFTAWEESSAHFEDEFISALAFRMDEVIRMVTESIEEGIHREMEDALMLLEQAQRRKVLDALTDNFSRHGVNELFVALWRTVHVPSRGYGRAIDPIKDESDLMILNSGSFAAVDAYGWLNDGCPD